MCNLKKTYEECQKQAEAENVAQGTDTERTALGK